MEALYIVEPGSYIRVEGDGLVIEKQGNILRHIPANGLERLTLMGRCSVTGAVLDFLIDRGIDTVFMTLTGRFRARLMLDAPGHIRLRQLQYQRLGSEDFCLNTSRLIVKTKIRNQSHLLMKRAWRTKDKNFRTLLLQLKALQRRTERATNLDELRGIEGSAARIFYQGFGLLIKNENFTFSGRNKRPPLDPVNAMLSFVYTLFTNQVVNAIKASGLDPYLGALHEPAHSRPSLACDLVEEWRTTAENFVLTIINKKMVRPDDFVKTNRKERPIEMTPSFMRALIKAYEKKMDKQIEFRGGNLALRWVVFQRVRDFINYLKEPGNSWPCDIVLF